MRHVKVRTHSREYPRHRVLKEGRIISSDLLGAIDVIIRDLSVGGAQVEIPSSVEIPQKFALLVSSEYLFYPASIRWRSGKMIGVEFVGEPYRMRTVID